MPLSTRQSLTPYVGKLTMFRVYSGVFKSDSHIYNVTQGLDERVGQVFILQGKEQIPVDEVGPGDLAAVAKLQATVTGDTWVQRVKPSL